MGSDKYGKSGNSLAAGMRVAPTADCECSTCFMIRLSREPEAVEPPYYVRIFWSPDRNHLVTANCYIPEGETNVTLSLQDDNGDVWDATGPTTDLTSQGSQSGETEPQLNAPGSDAPITGTSAKDAGTRNAQKSSDDLTVAALRRTIDRHTKWRERAMELFRQVERGYEGEWPELAEFIKQSDSRVSSSQRTSE